MDFEWRIKLTEPETGKRIKNLIRNRRINGKRLHQKDISNACSFSHSSLSRFLNCKEEIPGVAFQRLYEELKRYYQEREIEFLKDYIPPKALGIQPSSVKDLYFSYYVTQ